MANLQAQAPSRPVVAAAPQIPAMPSAPSPALDAIPPGPQEPDVLTRAKELYPFIKQHNPDVVVNSSHSNPDGYFAETFHPGDEGYEKYPNPRGKTDKTVIEVYRPDRFSEHDIAAEFLHVDPKAHNAREKLMQTFRPDQMRILKSQGDYRNGDGLSEKRRVENVTDALMRGYTVGQWPKSAIDEMKLDGKQRKTLDDLKAYMTGR